MWLWSSFEEVGHRVVSLKNISMKLAIVPKMLEKDNINIALITHHHNFYHNCHSTYYRHLLSSRVGCIESKQTT